jgi:superfamily I DNA and/or RNA helicase
VIDELAPIGRRLGPDRVAVVAAHNDQVHAVRYALSQVGVNPDTLVVSTANRVQGREYDVVLVWHPLAGRRDATAFHLEAGRMCVMLSRHRQACIVVGRGGADRLLAEFPDSDPIFLEEPEKFPDGWEANSLVLDHLAQFRTGV